jgi:serine/threonine protein kinase
MTDSLPLRLRLALGAAAELDVEEAATGGRRVFLARGRHDDARTAPTRRVILHPAPPDGPTLEQMQRRADQLLVLTHPAIAAPLASGDFEGRTWVVEPIPPGVPLAGRLAARGALSLREVTELLRDIARALVAMHRRDLSHGALSTAAVRLDPRGTVLTGLGLALDGSPGGDLRALGGLAWEMITGEPPSAVRPRTLRELRPSAPPELEQLVLGLLGDPEAGVAPMPSRAEDLLTLLDRFPPLAPEAITDFLDGVRGGGRTGRRPGGGMARLFGGIGILLGRLRGR